MSTTNMPPQFIPGAIINDQGHQIYLEEITHYAITGEQHNGNHAQHFVWRNFPRQQASYLDKQNHKTSRAGIYGGAFPWGMRCVYPGTTDVLSIDWIYQIIHHALYNCPRGAGATGPFQALEWNESPFGMTHMMMPCGPTP